MASSYTVEITLLWLTLILTQACFIRNCPPGGKRSLPLLDQSSRKCMPCGPSLSGQCIGPNICCGPDFGCFMGTEESEICEKENESTTPCELEGSRCGADGQGKCVADRLCCDTEACAFNSRCERSRPKYNPRLVSLLQRLLQERTQV